MCYNPWVQVHFGVKQMEPIHFMFHGFGKPDAAFLFARPQSKRRARPGFLWKGFPIESANKRVMIGLNEAIDRASRS